MPNPFVRHILDEIVAKFEREINRPTFKQNHLIDKVTFLDYANIYNWHFNLYGTAFKK